MTSKSVQHAPSEINAVLNAWRDRALKVVLIVLVVIALPAVIVPIVNALRFGAWSPWMYIYIFGYLSLLGLTFGPGINFQVRGWGVVLIGYVVAVVSLMRGGMAASGRLYLLWLPAMAVVLVGMHAGMITTGLSLAIYVFFTYLAHQGILAQWMLIWDNPLSLGYWIEAGTALAMFLGSLIVLLERFYRLQVETLIAERQASADLAAANVQLEDYSRTLESRVEQRTTELSEANARLRQEIIERERAEEALLRYTRELEASNAELDAFAHTVAHDLKNPLSVLVGFSSMLESRHARMKPERIQENLHTLTQTSKKMTNIINELLLLASVRKMEQLTLGPLDMGDIVAEAGHRLQDMIAQAGAVVNIPETWPTAYGYAPWIEEIWVNYLSNAVKYGGRPEEDIAPQIEIGYTQVNMMELAKTYNVPAPDELEYSTKSQCGIKFWVQDNGVGISEEAQSQLFVEFTRLEQARVEGHGLGLSIVRRIAEKLGGVVGVESVLGEGSTFWFVLPCAEGENNTGIPLPGS